MEEHEGAQEPTLTAAGERRMPNNAGQLKYILLMRHAQRAANAVKSSAGQAEELESIAVPLRKLAKIPKAYIPSPSQGEEYTKAVAERIKSHCEEVMTDLTVAGIIHAGSNEATKTAQIVQKILIPSGKVTPFECLDPQEFFKRARFDTQAVELTKQIDKKARCLCKQSEKEKGNAVLVVGHEPSLGWISYKLAGNAYPVTNSEVLCFELKGKYEKRPYASLRWYEKLRPYASLRWVVSPPDEKTIEDLRDKIRSKMGVANLLSAFIGAGLTFVTSTLADGAKIAFLGRLVRSIEVAALLLFLALILYLMTVVSYDTLLMPRRFWGESPVGADKRPGWIVERPPSSASWILYQNMLHVWKRQFIPATYFLVAGLFLLCMAVSTRITLPHGPPIHRPLLLPPPKSDWLTFFNPFLKFCDENPLRITFLAWLIVIILIIIFARLFSLGRYFGPWLGSED
jgi:phosphohistidine phosphatase SixA